MKYETIEKYWIVEKKIHGYKMLLDACIIKIVRKKMFEIKVEL